MLKLIFQALVLNKILTNYINNLNLKIMKNQLTKLNVLIGAILLILSSTFLLLGLYTIIAVLF